MVHAGKFCKVIKLKQKKKLQCEPVYCRPSVRCTFSRDGKGDKIEERESTVRGGRWKGIVEEETIGVEKLGRESSEGSGGG